MSRRGPDVPGTPPRARSWRALVVVAATAALAFAVVAGAFLVRDTMAGDRFDILRWERTNVWNKWLFHTGAPLREDLPDDEAIARYFALADRSWPEARELEQVVARAIERRIDAVLQDLGLTARVQLPRSVFPPVNIELVTPPRILVESPRSEIRRTRVELLRPDLTLDDVVAVEGEIEAHPDRSALVVRAGGIATYPAIVSGSSSYAQVVATSAHEWAHHYLVFYPLGVRYGLSRDLVTINETVADVIGDEVAEIVLERWGDPTLPVAPPEVPALGADSPEEPPARFDYFPALRDLRLEVDALLAEGRVHEAEARMEDVRRELQEHGIFFRRINQAFFAWHGSYAARPDAVDPLGRQIAEIRELTGSLPDFVRVIRSVTSRAEVESLLAELQQREAAQAREGTDAPA